MSHAADICAQNVTARDAARVDFLMIAEMVAAGTRVLDVGCGNGALLALLTHTRNVDARGIELSQRGVNEAVSRGLSVVQGNADTDLSYYPDNSFDYVILSQTLQATQRPKHVLEDMLRIGTHAIVSFPNFGHWRIRSQILFKGKMPVTENLSYSWHDAEYSFLHHSGFCGYDPRHWRHHRARRGAGSFRQADDGARTLVAVEYIWRAGRVHAAPRIKKPA